MDLALNNLKRLIYYKTNQPTNPLTNQLTSCVCVHVSLYTNVFLCEYVCCITLYINSEEIRKTACKKKKTLANENPRILVKITAWHRSREERGKKNFHLLELFYI